MSSPGLFTLSLDCEGLWGMADQEEVVRAGLITQETLAAAYDFIRRVLEQNGLLATCAFVSAFAAGPDVLRPHALTLRELAGMYPGWFTHILPAMLEGEEDGWVGTPFYKAMRASGHEMAWHGATHLSLADSTSAEAVELELQLADTLFDALGHRPTTIVFPRNEVGHLHRLRARGFSTYREQPSTALPVRAVNIAREWHVLDGGTNAHPWREGDWAVSPPGIFLNWPTGMRSLVPISVTVARWRSLLRSATSHGRYVHMWFHPHNLITAPAMKDCFEAVMREVGQLVRSGDLGNATIGDAVGLYGAVCEGAVHGG